MSGPVWPASSEPPGPSPTFCFLSAGLEAHRGAAEEPAEPEGGDPGDPAAAAAAGGLPEPEPGSEPALNTQL